GAKVLQIDAGQASSAKRGGDFAIGGREKVVEVAAASLEEDEKVCLALGNQVLAAKALSQTADLNLRAVEAQFHEFLAAGSIRAEADLEVAAKTHRVGNVEA